MEDKEHLLNLIFEFNKLSKTNILWAQEKGIPPYEVSHQLIIAAIGLIMSTQPDPLVAFQTVSECVTNGIYCHRESKASEVTND